MFFTILLLFGISAGCILAGKILIHYFQLESYQFPGYFRTVRRNLFKAILPGFCLTILLCVSLLIIDHVTSNAGNWLFCIIECFIMMIGGFLIGIGLEIGGAHVGVGDVLFVRHGWILLSVSVLATGCGTKNPVPLTCWDRNESFHFCGATRLDAVLRPLAAVQSYGFL